MRIDMDLAAIGEARLGAQRLLARNDGVVHFNNTAIWLILWYIEN